MDNLVYFLDANIDSWPSLKEVEARYALKSKDHVKELKSIEAYKARYPEETYEWPVAQNGHVDLDISGDTTQFKTARVNGSKAGLIVNLYTSAGKDEGGNKLHDPYPVCAFEVLIFAYKEEKKKKTSGTFGASLLPSWKSAATYRRRERGA
jgi:hypothetical protein